VGPHHPYESGALYRERFRTSYRGDLDASPQTFAAIRNDKRQLNPLELAHIASLYDGEVAEVDARVGQLLAANRDLGLKDDTLVVFTADHGEMLYDRHFYFTHSEAIHSGVLDVPLIIALPGAVPQGQMIASVVESIDLAPTVLQLIGLEIPDWMLGRSLAPLVAAADEPDARGKGDIRVSDAPAAYAVMGNYVRSIRTARWLYIENHMPGRTLKFPIAAQELYALEADPRNRRNVVERHPEVASVLRSRLAAWWEASLEHAVPGTPAEFTPEARAELEALGYLDDSETSER
jgi:arylsulfatase A-like enzyme